MPANNREISDLKKQVRELTERITDLAEENASGMAGQATDYLFGARNKAGEWVDTLRDQSEEVRERATRLAKDTEDYARENPWAIAAGALTVGMIVGFFLSRHD